MQEVEPGLEAGLEALGGMTKRSGSHSLSSSGHCQICIISSLIYKIDERPTTSLNLFRDTWQFKKNLQPVQMGWGQCLAEIHYKRR